MPRSEGSAPPCHSVPAEGSSGSISGHGSGSRDNDHNAGTGPKDIVLQLRVKAQRTMMVMMMMMMSAVFTAMLTTTAWSPRRWSVDDLGGVGRVVTCWWCCRYMTSATLRRLIVSSGFIRQPKRPRGSATSFAALRLAQIDWL